MNSMRQSGFFQLKEGAFSGKAQCISIFFDEVLFVVKLLQTMPDVESMKKTYYEFYYTIIKNRGGKQEQELDKYDNVISYLYDEIIMPTYNLGIKRGETLLK